MFTWLVCSAPFCLPCTLMAALPAAAALKTMMRVHIRRKSTIFQSSPQKTNLLLNLSKIEEIIVNFRKMTIIRGDGVEQLNCFRFLGINIREPVIVITYHQTSKEAQKMLFLRGPICKIGDCWVSSGTLTLGWWPAWPTAGKTCEG